MTAAPAGTAGAQLRDAIARLGKAGLETPERDARILLAHALQVPRHRLADLLDQPLGAAAGRRFAADIAARIGRRPVSQIIGRRSFWKHDFEVTRDTLDPRPDTETLVEAALEQGFASLLDLGTGTGAILISLMAERPGTRGLGTDISAPALEVARRNAARIGVGAEFIRSDWLAGVTGRFDLIVSNPPYIALSEIAALSPEVREWEPHQALTDGGDGLGAYRIIARDAPAHLAPGGRLILEIGPDQAADVTEILMAAGFPRPRVRQDLDGRDRVIVAHPGHSCAEIR